jgi:hypothetical protein
MTPMKLVGIDVSDAKFENHDKIGTECKIVHHAAL